MAQRNSSDLSARPDLGEKSESESTTPLTTPLRTTVDQTKLLIGPPLYKAVIMLNLSNAVAFMDIMSIAALLSVVAADLHAGSSISWAQTAQLVAAVVGQCFLGYMSDLVPRQKVLLSALALLAASALGCGLCSLQETPTPFLVCRAFTGLATGSISNLVNITQNDFLTKERRANFQGIQGISVACKSACGLLLGAALSMAGAEARIGWAVLYYIESVLAFLVMAGVYFWVPCTIPWPPALELFGLLKTVDLLGIIFGTGAIVPALLLIIEGKMFRWPSATPLALAVVAGMCAAAFFINGWFEPLRRYGVRPIVPFRLFRSRIIAVIYAQNVMIGWSYYAFMVFLVMYWHFIKQYNQLEAAALLLPYIATHALWSTISARAIGQLEKRKLPSFLPMFTFGFSCWIVAAVVLTFANDPSVGVACFLEVLVGLGTGSLLQNSVNVIREQAGREDSAVAIGTRNVLRFFGGAVSTAVSSAILQSVLAAHLSPPLKHFADSPFSKPNLSDLANADRAMVLKSYSVAIRMVFAASAAALVVALCGCVLLLKAKTSQQETKPSRSTSSESGVEMAELDGQYEERRRTG